MVDQRVDHLTCSDGASMPKNGGGDFSISSPSRAVRSLPDECRPLPRTVPLALVV